MQVPGADRFARLLTWKQPALGMHHALLPAGLPPPAQQGQQIRWQDGVAIPASFAPLDPDQHALAVDLGDLECHNLGDAQTRAVSDGESRLILEAGGCVEQSCNLVSTRHNGQIARMRRSDQLAGQIRPVDCLREEEPQCRDDAVHGRCRHASLTLLDLETPHVVHCRHIGVSVPGTWRTVQRPECNCAASRVRTGACSCRRSGAAAVG